MKRVIKAATQKFNFEAKQPWSKRYYTDEFSTSQYGDGKSHPVSTCQFSNGKSAVVFYDEYSYIVFDETGKYLDGNTCSSTREAKREAIALAFGEYKEYKDSVSASTTIQSSEEFDLSDDDQLYDVADWIRSYVREEIYKKINKRRKKNPREVWLDDVAWNENRFECQVWFDDGSLGGDYIGDFSCRLNFYDGPSESMDDIKYLVDEELRDFCYNL